MSVCPSPNLTLEVGDRRVSQTTIPELFPCQDLICQTRPYGMEVTADRGSTRPSALARTSRT